MTKFFQAHNLKPNKLVVLVDSRGRIWNSKIDEDASALSGGWAGFSKDHRLEVGDGLVVQMVFPYVFWMRIFKANQGGKEDDCSGAGSDYEGLRVQTETEVRKLSATQVRLLWFELLTLPLARCDVESAFAGKCLRMSFWRRECPKCGRVGEVLVGGGDLFEG
jgi:hypothetical protein